MNGFSHVNFTLGDPDGNVFFYRSIRVTSQDAQTLEKILKDVVCELSEKGVNVFCAVADNASAYQKALALLAKDNPSLPEVFLIQVKFLRFKSASGSLMVHQQEDEEDEDEDNEEQDSDADADSEKRVGFGFGKKIRIRSNPCTGLTLRSI